jgi:NADH-quinone oxidoreductase subunit L
VIGSLALAGVVPFSGFFSKDGVVAALLEEGELWAVGLMFLASAMTAFYMTRLYFRVWEGPAQTEHPHEGRPTMLAAMIALAAVTTVLGAAGLVFARFLGREGEWPTPFLVVVSTAVAVIGMGSGWWIYGRRKVVVNTNVWKARWRRLYGALQQKLYFDQIYDFVIIGPYARASGALANFDRRGIDAVVNAAPAAWKWISSSASAFDNAVVDGAVRLFAAIGLALSPLFARFDRSVVDGAVDEVGHGVVEAGGGVRRMLSGNVQIYLLLLAGSIVILVLVFAR